MSTIRREPLVPFSPAVGIAKWPIRWDRTAVIALVYDDRERLAADYERTGLWRRVNGVSALVHSAYLEKSPKTGECADCSYIDFGWRRYATRGRRSYAERPEERITVPMLFGTSNRPKVLGLLTGTEEMAVIFTLVSSLEDPAAFKNVHARLQRGGFPTADGTVLIPIKGVTVFGRFRPIGRRVSPKAPT